MSIELTVSGVKVIFTKFFTAGDKDAVLEAVRTEAPTRGAKRVLLVDTPPTPVLVSTVEGLLAEAFQPVLRDHHDIVGNPKNAREQDTRTAADALRGLLGVDATISDRGAHPACSLLVLLGEFAGDETLLVIADPDADGLMGAMRALGVVYSNADGGETAFNQDAALLDGPKSKQGGLSDLGRLLGIGWSTLPAMNPANLAPYQTAVSELFAQFVAAVGGDGPARTALEARVVQYEAAVAEATRLADTATQVATGVWLVDTTRGARYDLGTLTGTLEAKPGCVVTIIRKKDGPIAAKPQHGGVQYSCSVPTQHQPAVNLQDLLPSGFTSSPDVGLISNTTFLLHLSEGVWTATVLPALQQRFGSVS
jgi:hypothetical protein